MRVKRVCLIEQMSLLRSVYVQTYSATKRISGISLRKQTVDQNLVGPDRFRVSCATARLRLQLDSFSAIQTTETSDLNHEMRCHARNDAKQ